MRITIPKSLKGSLPCVRNGTSGIEVFAAHRNNMNFCLAGGDNGYLSVRALDVATSP